MIKEKVFNIIGQNENGSKISKIFNNFILLLIILSVISIVLESFNELNAMYSRYFKIFEAFSVIVFSIEYILRIWTADLKYDLKNGFTARIKYIFSFMGLIDLFAILPFYLPMLIPFDLRFLRILRLTRLLRIFKLNRYSKALDLIIKVCNDKKEEIFVTLFLMTFIILTSSTLIYYIESEVQPDKFPNIIASFWWAIATLTTVGYGDIYPVTVTGKVLASLIAISGIGLVALPTGIISSGFLEEIKGEERHICPKCGNKFED